MPEGYRRGVGGGSVVISWVVQELDVCARKLCNSRSLDRGEHAAAFERCKGSGGLALKRDGRRKSVQSASLPREGGTCRCLRGVVEEVRFALA